MAETIRKSGHQDINLGGCPLLQNEPNMPIDLRTKYDALEREYHRIMFDYEKLQRQIYRITAENVALNKRVEDLKLIKLGEVNERNY
jgi:hypothetical protein